MIEFKMPSLGADMEDGTLIEWKKKPGDTVKRGDIIAEVETQKGLIEIEIFDEGIIDKFLIQEGTKVPVGTVMALLQTSGVSLDTKKEKEAVALQPTEEKTIKSTAAATAETRKIKVSPLARRIAEENHINLELVAGTGPDGAITKEDVDHVIAKKEKIEPEKISAPAVAIRSAIAAAMSKSNREIPHYYLEKKIDLTKALAWLQETNGQRSVKKRLLPVVLLIKATARSLADFPDLNAIWENGLQQKKRY